MFARTALCGLLFALCLSTCKEKAESSSKAIPPPAASVPADRQETSEYVVSLSAHTSGGTVSITAKPPLHINPDYPTAFLADPGQVRFEAPRVALTPHQKKPCSSNAADTCETTSSLKLEGAEVGADVAGVIQFSVCEPGKCLVEKVKLQTKVAASP